MAESWSRFNEKLIAKTRDGQIPYVGQFELTPRCNFKCRMCYICRPISDKAAIESEIPSHEWIRIASEARDAGMLHLMITGGEVFVRSDFREIYEAFVKMGLVISINTNAAMITEELAKWLGRIPPAGVSVTIYGASEETYGKVCRCEDGLKLALLGIDRLIEEGIPVTIRTTVVNENKNDFLKMAEFSESRGVQFGIVNYIFPGLWYNRADSRNMRLAACDLAEYEEMVNEYFDNKYEKNDETGLSERMPAVINPNDDISADSKSENGAFPCEAGKTSFWITWDGRMVPCGLMDQPAVKPFEIGFKKAWGQLQSLCCSVPKCEACDNCSERIFCMTCPARLKAETGAFTEPAPYLCELARHRKIKSFNIRQY